MLWRLDTLLKESVDWKNSHIKWFPCMKKSLIEDKRNNKAQRPHTCRNPKRHISLVSLLLCIKIVSIRCFLWALHLQMWAASEAGSEAVRQLDEISSIYDFFTNSISSHLEMFFCSKCNIRCKVDYYYSVKVVFVI